MTPFILSISRSDSSALNSKRSMRALEDIIFSSTRARIVKASDSLSSLFSIRCSLASWVSAVIVYFSLTGMVVMKRNTTIALAMPQPIIACTAGLAGINPTKPCKTDRHANAIPNCTVLDFSACFTMASLLQSLVPSGLQC